MHTPTFTHRSNIHVRAWIYPLIHRSYIHVREMHIPILIHIYTCKGMHIHTEIIHTCKDMHIPTLTDQIYM